jgi:Na+-transporting methylmalonyl-CoA/oxaloacetate decarboxylase beta subunit
VIKMKILKTAMLTIIAVGLVASFAPAAGGVAKGKVLFNDAKLAGGTAGMSCNSCDTKSAEMADIVAYIKSLKATE